MLNRRMVVLGSLLATAMPISASAELLVRYIESAPKDRFLIDNLSPCALSSFTLKIDLGPSAGKLIFDTEIDGAGINVAQPFELVQGNERVTGVSEVGDGSKLLSLSFDRLAKDEPVVFTIDLDDTLASSGSMQTRVSGAEIEGAEVRFETSMLPLADGTKGVFSNLAEARLAVAGCVS